MIQHHDRVRARRDVGIETLLHARTPGEYHVSIGRSINRLLGKSDRFRRRAAFRVGLVAHHADVPFGNRFFEAFAFLFVNENGQFVRLNVEARIENPDVSGENADALLGVEGRFVGENLGRDRLAFRVRGGKRGGRLRFCRRGGLRGTRRLLPAGPRRGQDRKKIGGDKDPFHGFAAGPAISFWLKIVIWTLPAIVPWWVRVLNSIVSPAISKSARLIIVRRLESMTRVSRFRVASVMSTLKSGFSLLVVGHHLQVGKVDVVFINPGGSGGFKAAEQMPLEIVIGQDQALGFVPDSERNVFETKVFFRRVGRGRRRRLAVFAIPGDSQAAAREQEDETQARPAEEAGPATTRQHE